MSLSSHALRAKGSARQRVQQETSKNETSFSVSSSCLENRLQATLNSGSLTRFPSTRMES